MERLTEQMKQAQGITEQLKAENALEWTQRMNNIRACAKEIVEKKSSLHKAKAAGRNLCRCSFGWWCSRFVSCYCSFDRV